MKRLGRPPKSLVKTKPPPAVVETVSSRVGGRERKAKKVFDPSENNTPKKRMKASKSSERARTDCQETKYKSRTESKSISPKSKYSMDEYCSLCNKEEKKMKALVNCNDCNLKAHIECLNTSFEDKKLLQAKWRCDNCKTCAICYETEEIDELITCSICINSYHITCHVPKVNTNLVHYEDWRCTKCPAPSSAVSKPQQSTNQVHTKPPTILKSHPPPVNSSALSMTSENSSSSFSSITTQTSTKKELVKNKAVTPPTAAPVPTTTVKIKEEKTETTINLECKQSYENEQKPTTHKLELDEVPDISKWSCEKVADFMKKVFPHEAELMRDQDIDGQSLLLMTRRDVLSLGLKLGAALRLYNFILGLQTRKYDNYATWIY